MKALIPLCALLLMTIRGDLLWAPIRTLQKPFLTFLNDVHNPSFMSTHYNTHQQQTFSMSLPRNNYFGLICGACFSSSRSSSYKPNLTMSIFNDHSFTSDHKTYWSRSRFNKCLVVYGVTHIEEESGNLTCVLQLGVKTFKHIVRARASYYTDTGKVIRVDKNLSDYSTLDCDEKKNATGLGIRRMTIWWYERENSDSITPAYISKNTSFPGHPPPNVNVACATFYGINRVRRVYQRRYYAGAAYFSPSAAADSRPLRRIWENSFIATLMSFLYRVLNVWSVCEQSATGNPCSFT